MPRKRKRSTLQNKPSLLFTESPVNIQKNVPSPVFCARHPQTAKSVPVDEIELPWVSPQFRGIPNSGGPHGRRLTRQRRRSVASTMGHDKENVMNANHRHSLHVLRDNKYKSLKFVGDQTTVASIQEDVHISCDSDTATEDEDDRCRVLQNRKRFSERLSSTCFDQVEIQNGSNVERGLRRESPVKNGPETHEEMNNCKTNCGDESSVIDSGKFQIKPLKGAPVKKLFASQLGQCNFEEEKSFCSETEPETVSNTESESEVTPKLRRSLRIYALRKALETDITPMKKVPSVILAPDTPEEEYGWPLRKRQLKSFKSR